LTTLLGAAERAGNVKLTRAADGSITVGEVIEIEVPCASLQLRGYAPAVAVGPAGATK
jgi:hypothetical protein